VASCAWFIADLLMEAFYRRVVLTAGGRIAMRALLILIWGSTVAIGIVLATVPGAISTASICTISWTPDTQGAGLVQSVAAGCKSLDFPLVLTAANVNASTLTFESLQSVAYTITVHNTTIQSIVFTAIAPTRCCWQRDSLIPPSATCRCDAPAPAATAYLVTVAGDNADFGSLYMGSSSNLCDPLSAFVTPAVCSS
jgi:hypothetical protein